MRRVLFTMETAYDGKEELYARIEELERELAEERIRRKITEDNLTVRCGSMNMQGMSGSGKRIQKSRNRTLPEWRQRKAFR